MPPLSALEHDERVVAHALLVERVDHPADLIVHGGDLGGIGAPGRIFNRLIPIEIGLRRLIGRVRRVEGEVEEERNFGVVAVDQFDGVVAEKGRGIARLANRLVVAEPVEHAVLLVGEIVELANERPILVIEPALARPIFGIGVAEVPFADNRRLIAGVLQRLGQKPLVGRQAPGVARWNNGRLKPVSERIPTGHQGRAGGGAHGLGIKLLEPRAARGKRVDVRRLDVGAVVADVLPALVVRNDVDDVGRLGLRGLRACIGFRLQGRGGDNQRRGGGAEKHAFRNQGVSPGGVELSSWRAAIARSLER